MKLEMAFKISNNIIGAEQQLLVLAFFYELLYNFT
jgi:hypothetical protein